MTEEDIKALENYSYTMSAISSATEQDTGIGNLIYKFVQAFKEQQKEIETSKQKEKFYKKLSEDNDYFATELENKNQLEKEIADDIDKVAVELSKLSDNIYIVNQAMLLQKIAQEKLGKFYID